MKVVYEKSVADRIMDIKQEAERENKKIEHLLLTEKEAVELYHSLSPPVGFLTIHIPRRQMCKVVNKGHFCDILVKVEGHDD